MPLHTALFVETNPSPAKHALKMLGRMSDEVRLPMIPGARGRGRCFATPWSMRAS
jgi:dihydrodipicolinate synthase/N-acetylneuraminate lyase